MTYNKNHKKLKSLLNRCLKITETKTQAGLTKILKNTEKQKCRDTVSVFLLSYSVLTIFTIVPWKECGLHKCQRKREEGNKVHHKGILFFHFLLISGDGGGLFGSWIIPSNEVGYTNLNAIHLVLWNISCDSSDNKYCIKSSFFPKYLIGSNQLNYYVFLNSKRLKF